MFRSILLFALLVILHQVYSESPLTRCETGQYKGKTLTSRDGKEYEAFIGIKYGIIPDRFEVSKSVPHSDDVKNSVEFGPNCPQYVFGTTILRGREDCLYLNVFTPKSDNKKRSVLVFIHGGGFAWGSADIYGANYFMDEDIVLVTLNYRLGIFGFLNTNDEMSPGNFGVRDQNLALKWVQRNIEHFGGNKDSITIMGESAGAASVTYQILSPLSKGLFHKAIPLSGTALNPWAFKEKNLDFAVQMGLKLDCGTSNSKALVTCLRTKSVHKLIEVQNSFAKWFVDPLFPFSPTIEKKNSKNPHPFLDKFPEDLMSSGEFNQVPMLVTMCRSEGLIFHAAVVLRNENLLKDMNAEWGRVAPITFLYEDDPILKSHTKEVSIKLKEFYFNNQEISQDNADNLTNIYTDTWFFRGIREGVLRMGKYVDIHLGIVDHRSKDISLTQILGIPEVLGTGHADDLSYLFSNGNREDPLKLVNDLKSAEDIKFSEAFVKQVANFVKTGDTNLVFGSSGKKWKTVSKSELNSRKLNWQTLSNNPQVDINYAEARVNFWDEIVKPDLSFKEEL